MSKMTKQEYKKFADSKAPKSPIVRNVCFAFVIGGLICCVGQGFSDIYSKLCGLGELESSSATSITMIFLGALFTGLGIYDKLAKYAGGGTIVPITGFANSIVSPAMEHKSEGYILGLGAKMFVIAGPVLVFGISSAVVAGIILWILGMY